MCHIQVFVILHLHTRQHRRLDVAWERPLPGAYAGMLQDRLWLAFSLLAFNAFGWWKLMWGSQGASWGKHTWLFGVGILRFHWLGSRTWPWPRSRSGDAKFLRFNKTHFAPMILHQFGNGLVLFNLFGQELLFSHIHLSFLLWFKWIFNPGEFILVKALPIEHGCIQRQIGVLLSWCVIFEHPQIHLIRCNQILL